jgi:hypothetical protein
MSFALKPRTGTKSFHLFHDNSKIGTLAAPIEDSEAGSAWAILIGDAVDDHGALPAPLRHFYTEFSSLDAALAFLGLSEAPEHPVYVPWSYQDSFVSAVAA